MNNDDYNDRFNSLKELQSMMKKTSAPFMEMQGFLSNAFRPTTQLVNRYLTDIVYPGADIIVKQLKQVLTSPAMENMKSKFGPPTVQVMQDLSYIFKPSIKSINTILENYTQLYKSFHAPTLDWLRGIDFYPITSLIKSINLTPEIIEQLFKLNEIYYQAMYESKWFPFADGLANEFLFKEIMDIIASSRGASKRREKRIDKLILSYYNDSRIRLIKKNWKASDLDRFMKKASSEALDAFLREEYILTITCLSTMWEGIIYIKAKNVDATQRQRQKMSITKEQLKELISNNDFEAIYADFFNTFIFSDCSGVSDVVEGVPNRNGVAHSWFPKYPSKKAALNAILLTDFIISLTPNEQTEEEENG